MKKIMVVDDEILTRESIRNSVDWLSHGYIYCGDASDGEMALPLIEQWQPEILITDIKMPFMDGIELSTIVRKNYPQIKIIILSGHDEFRFAQKAIRAGVQDYCLKPVGSKDLLDLLNKVSKQIDDEQQKRESYSYSEDKLLSELCGGLISTAKALDIATIFDLSLLAPYYAVITVEHITLRHNDLEEELDEHVKKETEEKLIAYFSNQIKVLSYKPSRKEIVFILQAQEQLLLHKELHSFPIKIADNDSIAQQIVFGIGQIKTRLPAVHESFLEAINDKQNLFHTKLNQHALDRFLLLTAIQKPIVDRQKFNEFLKLGTQERLESFVHHFCEHMNELNWQSSMYGIYLLNDITIEAFHTAKTTFVIEVDHTAKLQSFQAIIKDITSLEQAKLYLQKLIQTLWEWRSASSNMYNSLISKVKQYIAEHYHNKQLSLQDVSKHVGISPSHLSKVFSQETKQTLTEFITQTRMNKAMELLKTTHYKTFQIAFEVGYQDQHYFSNTFKKVTGVTPMEYRKNGILAESNYMTLQGDV